VRGERRGVSGCLYVLVELGGGALLEGKILVFGFDGVCLWEVVGRVMRGACVVCCGRYVGGRGFVKMCKGFGVGRAWECGGEKRVGCSGGWEVGGWILGGALMGGGKHGLGDIECCGRLEAVGLDVQGKGVGL